MTALIYCEHCRCMGDAHFFRVPRSVYVGGALCHVSSDERDITLVIEESRSLYDGATQEIQRLGNELAHTISRIKTVKASLAAWSAKPEQFKEAEKLDGETLTRTLDDLETDCAAQTARMDELRELVAAKPIRRITVPRGLR